MDRTTKLELAGVVLTALAHLLTWSWPVVHAVVVLVVMAAGPPGSSCAAAPSSACGESWACSAPVSAAPSP